MNADLKARTLKAGIYWSNMNPKDVLVVLPDPKPFRTDSIVIYQANDTDDAHSMIERRFKVMGEQCPEIERSASIMRGGLILETINDPNIPPVYEVIETFGYRYELTEKGKQVAEAMRRAAASEDGVS